MLTLEPSSSSILAALGAFQPLPVVFPDPNVRPAVISDAEAFRSRMDEAMAIASIMKLSDEDLSYLYPHVDVHAKAASLAQERGLHVILTLGRDGAVWYTPEGTAHRQGIIDLPVIDTVGAGDTFSGSILTYLHDRGSFGRDGESRRCTRSPHGHRGGAYGASAASAINCSRKGCDPPTKEEVASLLASL